MYTFISIITLTAFGCSGNDTVDEGPADGGLVDAGLSDAATDAGSNSLLLGIIGAKDTGAYQELNLDFETMPLNWNSVEQGPNDVFHATQLDTKKWDLTFGAAGAASVDWDTEKIGNRHLSWTGTPNSSDEFATVASSFVLSDVDPSHSYDATINARIPAASVDGSYAAFRLSYADNNGNPTDCVVGDFHTALVFLKSAGEHFLIGESCRNGTKANSAIISLGNVHEASLRLGREMNTQILEYSIGGDYVPLQNLEFSDSAFSALTPRVLTHFGLLENFATATAIQIDDFELSPTSVTWDDPADRFAVDPAFDVLALLDSSFGGGINVIVTLRSVDTVSAPVPSDLNDCARATGACRLSLGRQQIQDRFVSFVDHVFERLPNVNIVGLSIGNEVNGYLGDDVDAWASYIAFTNGVVPRLRQEHGPNLPIGVKITSEAFLEDSPIRPLALALNENTDVVMVNYYPLTNFFGVEEPGVIFADLPLLDQVLSSNPDTADKEVYFMELGYQSAPMSQDCDLCNSSEEMQRQFFENLFVAWPDYKERVRAINVSWISDLTPEDALQTATSYIPNPPSVFVEYLRTLGLTRADGNEKPSYAEVRSAALAR